MAEQNDAYDAQTPPVYPEQTEPARASSFGAALNVMGGLASLALVVGIGVWGYKLVVRDVSGVPVVRALEGPMRIQPENPGGRPADHQGLAVNTVAAKGTAAPTAERLMLAPKPVDLAEEDVPMGPLAEIGPAIDAAVKAVVDPAAQETSAATPPKTAQTQVSYEAGSIDALVQELTRDATVSSVVQSDTTSAKRVAARITQPVALDPELEPKPAVLTGPGLKTSLRPQVRPSQRATPARQVQPDMAGGASVLDVDPDTVPTGTRLAQLGAFESPEVARDEWDKLDTRFGDYLDDKSRVIQKASSGGRTFYRLRAMGFDDLSDARRFCSALVAEQADCIPVIAR